MSKVTWVVADGFSEYNSSHFRCTILYNQLVKNDSWEASIVTIDDWLTNNDNCKKECSNSDIIIIQRVLVKESLNVALYYKQIGAKVYVDFDDAYQLIGEENAAYAFWGEGKVNMPSPLAYQKLDMKVENPVQQFKRAIGDIDGGITPSRILSRDWALHGKMSVLKNYLDWERYDGEYQLRLDSNHKSPRLGWGGSMSHLTSFTGSGIVPALQEMTNRELGKFLLVGDKRVIPLLRIPPEKVLFNPYVMWMDWIRVVLSFDIGLAPLSGAYDCRRSRLKVMEYIALGIPFIATKSNVYEDFFNCTSGIFIDQGDLDVCDVSNSDAWLSAIESMCTNFGTWKKEAEISRDEYKSIIAVEDQDLAEFFDNLL